jgi:hypothetical protein
MPDMKKAPVCTEAFSLGLDVLSQRWLSGT